MTSRDYMKLPKHVLAEELARRDSLQEQRQTIQFVPTPTYQPPCYAPDGICTNPCHDCMNCPRFGHGNYETRPDTKIK